MLKHSKDTQDHSRKKKHIDFLRMKHVRKTIGSQNLLIPDLMYCFTENIVTLKVKMRGMVFRHTSQCMMYLPHNAVALDERFSPLI